MPMLAAETESTTAKPSMTFARNRKVGSLSDIDRGQTRLDNPTSNPRLLSENRPNRQYRLPGPKRKTGAEWIKGRKFVPSWACFPPLRGAKRRSNPVIPKSVLWIASRSLASGAHSRDPLARNDGLKPYCQPHFRPGSEERYAARDSGGANACQPEASCSFGSVSVCSFSSVMPGIISITDRPCGVTSITARLV